MDHRTWLWRKKSSEKTIVAIDKPELSLKVDEEELPPSEKEVALERSVQNLNEKLASVICEYNAKDELLANHAKMSEEAIAGREKAEAEAVFLKQELDEALQQNVAANDRLTHLNAALKEYMQQLSSLREEQDQRVLDAVMKTSKEYEKAHKKLEEKFTEKSKRLANVTAEYAHLSKAFLLKEKIIEDISKRMSQAEAEFNTLMARLDSTEKENAFLKYEFRMLEKELEIRNEEMEFNRRSADASHKLHIDSVKKLTKLEAECQRLRVLVRKRLPGPAALAKMKSEAETQGRNQDELRRRRVNPVIGGLAVRDSTVENPQELPSKRASFLIEQLCNMEEENKILKEVLAKRDDELRSLRTTFARTVLKLSQAEAQIEELAQVKKPLELAVCSPMSSELVRASSCDMSLMDDFVEMEKLAIVSVDGPPGSSHAYTDASRTISNSKESCGHSLDSTGKELVPVTQGDASDMEIQTRDWLQDILNVILEQNRASNRSLDELLEDIRIGLQYMDVSRAKLAEPCKLLPISGYITWKSPNSAGSLKEILDIDTPGEEKKGLQYELKNKYLEERMQSANDKSEVLMGQLRESEQSIKGLETEVEKMKESKRIIEDQIENQKLINEDLVTQLTVAKAKLNEVLRKLSSLEVELENKNQCCEELETTCLELQLQLESVNNKETPKDNADQEEKLLQTGWEITAASAKLAECQETIFNLGKQLKALASPNESAVFDKVFSTPSTTNSKRLSQQRSSLRDQMLAEDGIEHDDLTSPKTKEIISTEETKKPSNVHSDNRNTSYAPNVEVAAYAAGALAIVPSKKRGGGSSLLRKLLLRRKRGSSKKTSLYFAA